MVKTRCVWDLRPPHVVHRRLRDDGDAGWAAAPDQPARQRVPPSCGCTVSLPPCKAGRRHGLVCPSRQRPALLKTCQHECHQGVRGVKRPYPRTWWTWWWASLRLSESLRAGNGNDGKGDIGWVGGSYLYKSRSRQITSVELRLNCFLLGSPPATRFRLSVVNSEPGRGLHYQNE